MLLSPGSRARPRQFTPTRRQQGLVQFGSAIDPTLLVNYIGGLVMSNDATTPNSVLDVAAGVCSDSTNSVLMRIPAMTKSIATAWAPGSGKGGLAKGTPLSATSWYHVFVFNTAAGPDLLFDTSVIAANIPAPGPFRRIGSVKTDGSSNILAFKQSCDTFTWSAVITELNTAASGTTLTTLTLGGVPPNVSTTVMLRGIYNPAVANSDCLISGGDEATALDGDAAGRNRNVQAPTATSAAAYQLTVQTNISNQIKYQTATSSTLNITNFGYIDTRGR